LRAAFWKPCNGDVTVGGTGVAPAVRALWIWDEKWEGEMFGGIAGNGKAALIFGQRVRRRMWGTAGVLV